MRVCVGTIAVLALLWAARLDAQQATWVFLESESDRAIPQSLIRKIEKTGARIRVASGWLQAVSVDADAAALGKLRRMREVKAMQPVGSVHAAAGTRTRAISQSRTLAHSHTRTLADFDSAFYGANWKAIRQLGIPASHLLGFTARGIRIAILDTGFEPMHQALASRLVIAQRDFINGDGTVSNEANDPIGALDQEVHGTEVWSILGGHHPGRLVGPAFDASFILAKVDVVQVGPEDFAADEDRWVAAVHWADSMGARIINSSLTFRDFVDQPDYPPTAMNGRTAISTRMADEAARRGILVINAIGDLGPDPQSLAAPADADSIISVGAIDALGLPLASSSRGPAADGRLKPELVALGTGLTGALPVDLQSYAIDLEGTSFATPLIAGGAAMFMQAWPSLTIMAVRNALLLSGTRAELSDNNVGFGVPNISSAILFPEGLNPVGITGVNLENQLTTIQPTFTWSAPLVNQAMAPVLYRLEIATDPAFGNIIYTDTTSGFSITIKRPLRPAPALFWRVVAEAFPDIRRTTRPTTPFSVPDWIRLITFNTPTPSLTDSIQPTLRWESLAAPPPSGPLVFTVQVLSAQSGAPVQTMTDLVGGSVRVRDPLTPNIPFRWRVIARSPTGVADTVESVGNFVVQSDRQPPATLLYQNFPNPFPRPDLGENGTHVWFDVNTRSTIELAVHDLRGRLIRQLIPASASCGAVTLAPGQYGRTPDPDPCVSTEWDGRAANGATVPRGVYILRLRAGGSDQVKRILYMPVD